ncbi:DUF3306 domain-containing protein [Methylophaga sp.]|uniref:DUF3306 domain-containing protein n=1 Tax=Methylophaga sp. TaxID=2024840 RepID=UPI0014008BBF|nr:DUF3306 domain-containing protein [Methylophaga sp.]MTI63273.1 DUF3306 domain-containing protein [Methylophaga sp.]
MSREQEDKGFLSRWSKRKLEKDTENAPDSLPAETTTSANETDGNSSESAVEAQSETIPVWQREDVDAETKKAALRSLFRKPEFNVRDGLNEYDDDFTRFAGLGDIVTQDMKRMLKLAEEKTRPPQMPENKAAVETDRQQDNNKGDYREDEDFA